MTPESFCRYFKKHTLKTYHIFLNEIRIQEACRLIVNNPNMSMATVAIQTGFNSSISFIRVFKKTKNTTPLVYQRKYLAGQYI
jgi:transcriptional regulator GlxA family with amidase domain